MPDVVKERACCWGRLRLRPTYSFVKFRWPLCGMEVWEEEWAGKWFERRGCIVHHVVVT